MRNCKLLATPAAARRVAVARTMRAMVAALLAVLAASAAEVRASCGDYVHVSGGGDAAAPVGDEHLSLAHQFTLPTGLDSHPPAPLAPSCQGPNCRRQLPQPTHSVPPVSMARTQQWACWLSDVERSDVKFADRAIELSLHPLAGHRQSIEHPPRLIR
ncbi:MAG TPA: hypothetical protein VJ783_04020 [Pirellulales bacterium]|nr:hypothetical protein [Pirellulales bacterium]